MDFVLNTSPPQLFDELSVQLYIQFVELSTLYCDFNEARQPQVLGFRSVFS